MKENTYTLNLSNEEIERIDKFAMIFEYKTREEFILHLICYSLEDIEQEYDKLFK